MVESREHFVRERLDYIRSSVKCGVKEFDYSKTFKIDLLIKEELDKMYDEKMSNPKTKDKYYVVNGGISSYECKKLKKLVLYYYAIYNDNLVLLKKLVEENFKFEDSSGNLHLYALDRNFTKYFNEDELVSILKCSGTECKSFYNKLMNIESKKINYPNRKELLEEYTKLRNKLLFGNLSDEERIPIKSRLEEIASQINIEFIYKYGESERDKIMSDYVSLMRINPMISKRKNQYDDEFSYRNLVTPSNLEILGVDTLLSLNDYQKDMINRNYNAKDTYVAIRMKELIDKNPDFYTRLTLNDEILNNLTNDDIINLTPEMEEIFEKAALTHNVSRIKGLVKKEFCLEENMDFIDNDFLDSLSDEEIMRISLKAKTKIRDILLNKKRILHKANNNRYVLTKKIKGIAARDLFTQDIVSKLK